MSIVSYFTDPYALPFMQRALMIAIIIAMPMAILSCYLVLKGWALVGDAISHAVLPGIVLAYILGIPLIIGAFFAGLACSGLSGFVTANSRLKSDTVLGIVFSAMFAVGLLMYLSADTSLHLDHILFGNVLGTSDRDIVEALAICLPMVIFLLIAAKPLLTFVFDEVHAASLGLPIGLLRFALLSAVAIATVTALDAAGIIMAIALLISPGATAFLIARRFSTMIIVAVAISVFSSALGTTLSFHLDSATAPTIVLVMTALFILAFLREILLRNVNRRNAEDQISTI